MDDVSMNGFFFKRQVGVPYHGDSQKFTHLSLIDFWPLHFRTIFVILTELSIISRRPTSIFCNFYRIFMITVKISWVGPFEISRGCYEQMNQNKARKQFGPWIYSPSYLFVILHTSFIVFVLSFCLLGLFSNGFTYRVKRAT